MPKPKVFIGVGHGGTDPGAVGNGLKEKNLTLAISNYCAEALKNNGVDVKLSRSSDVNDPIEDEIKECNSFKPELAVDIHINAGGGNGAEVYYHYGGGKGKTLANNILCEIVNIGQESRGAKTKKNSNGKDYYAFIRETDSAAVIVEAAFIDNSKDIKIVNSAAKQKTMGVAIAKGILKTLEMKYKEPKLYRVQVGAFKSKKNAEALKTKLIKAGFRDINIV